MKCDILGSYLDTFLVYNLVPIYLLTPYSWEVCSHKKTLLMSPIAKLTMEFYELKIKTINILKIDKLVFLLKGFASLACIAHTILQIIEFIFCDLSTKQCKNNHFNILSNNLSRLVTNVFL